MKSTDGESSYCHQLIISNAKPQSVDGLLTKNFFLSPFCCPMRGWKIFDIHQKIKYQINHWIRQKRRHAQKERTNGRKKYKFSMTSFNVETGEFFFLVFGRYNERFATHAVQAICIIIEKVSSYARPQNINQRTKGNYLLSHNLGC